MSEENWKSDISKVLLVSINQLIEIADKYNYDRDSVISAAADTFKAMSKISTFNNYKEASNK